MKIRFSEEVYKKLFRVKRSNPVLYRLIKIKLELFENNSNYPSLRKHKLSGGMKESWSISINRSIRMLYVEVNEGENYFFDIGKHEEVYK